MVKTWLLLFVSIVASQDINHSVGDKQHLNTTTLYPVTSKTIDNSKNSILQHNRSEDTPQEENKTDIVTEAPAKDNSNERGKVNDNISKKEKVTKWSVDANYASAEYEPTDVNTKDKKNDNPRITDSKEKLSVERLRSNSDDKEFKPSPHLGNFFDDENLNLLKFTTPQSTPPIEKKPIRDFVSAKDLYTLYYKSPKDTYREQIDAPYRFESAHFLTNNWKQTLESKPTVESSVKVPAGGLYKHSNPFKEKPSAIADGEDFGLAYTEDGREIENPVKKRSNPWKGLLQLVTAFLPVGLIISALTPSVITLQTTDNDPYLSRRWRRADGGLAGVPRISESCRRRLLCEIHAEENYVHTSQALSRLPRKRCYKLRCEEPDALRTILVWLLEHRPGPRPPPGLRRQDLQHGGVMEHHHRNSGFT